MPPHPEITACDCGTIAETMQRPSGNVVIMQFGEGGGTIGVLHRVASGVSIPGGNGDIRLGELISDVMCCSGVVYPPCSCCRGSSGQLPGGAWGACGVPAPFLRANCCFIPGPGDERGPIARSVGVSARWRSMLGTARFTSTRLPPRNGRKRDSSPPRRRSTAPPSENSANPKPRCFWQLTSLCFCSQHFFTPGACSHKSRCTSSSSTSCGMPPMKTLWAFGGLLLFRGAFDEL
jgi:hypothetical protein